MKKWHKILTTISSHYKCFCVLKNTDKFNVNILTHKLAQSAILSVNSTSSGQCTQKTEQLKNQENLLKVTSFSDSVATK